MEFQDDAFVLSARLHGDTGAVVELLTEQYGRRAAYVNGGASRKMKPFLQAGTKVVADFRSRTSDQLGSARLEPMGEGPASLFDDPLALVGLNAAADARFAQAHARRPRRARQRPLAAPPQPVGPRRCRGRRGLARARAASGGVLCVRGPDGGVCHCRGLARDFCAL